MQIRLCLNKHAFMRILTQEKGCDPLLLAGLQHFLYPLGGRRVPAMLHERLRLELQVFQHKSQRCCCVCIFYKDELNFGRIWV